MAYRFAKNNHLQYILNLELPFSTYISQVFNLRILQIWNHSQNYFNENFDIYSLQIWVSYTLAT